MKLPSGFHVRPLEQGDTNFVVGTFLDSWLGSYGVGPFPVELHRPTYRDTIHGLLARPHAQCLLVCLSEMPDFVVAWALAERFSPTMRGLDQPVLHYVYVKSAPAYRRRGIATALVEAAGIDPRQPFRHTFDTKDWERVTFEKDKRGLRKKAAWCGARRDPTLVWFQHARERRTDDEPARETPTPPIVTAETRADQGY